MKKNFTLIELSMVVAILGILAAVAIPACLKFQLNAKDSACKGALGGLRSGIAIWYAKSATTGTPVFPAFSDITAISGGVMVNGSIPPNPYVSKNNDATVIVTTASSVRTTASRAGWVYHAASGSIWGATSDSNTF